MKIQIVIQNKFGVFKSVPLDAEDIPVDDEKLLAMAEEITSRGGFSMFTDENVVTSFPALIMSRSMVDVIRLDKSGE